MLGRTRATAILTLALLATGLPALAADVRVVGLFGSKAVVSLDGGAPTTMRIGQRAPNGARLLAIEGESAIFEIDGQRRALRMGQPYVSRSSGGAPSVRLSADANGHYMANGSVNGSAMRFLVDTGATMVALPAVFARQAGIRYSTAPRGTVQTAGGPTTAYKVKLDTVTIGGVTLNNVDAVVIDRGLNVPLLGMTFLSRMEIQRDGELMVLKKRF
ncbi:MAG: TIGR02281 family clan AA aspartic protease [Betaproteobacteria bacterium]|jgi:aspartyl protease family protein|nr:TIGR02281 family clan AA aspartic protease [Betaproteobacteria bacterium]